MITLRFTYNPTWYNRAIKLYTWYPYTHVDYVKTTKAYTYYLGALPNRGVIGHRFTADREKFMTFDCDSVKFEEFMESQLGKKYDWWGIFGLAFNRPDQDRDKWFCSELIGSAMNYAKPNTFSIPTYKLTPRDIALVCTPSVS